MCFFCFIFNKRGFFTPHKRKISCFFTTKQAQTYAEIYMYKRGKDFYEKIFSSSGQYPNCPLEGHINQIVAISHTLANKNFKSDHYIHE